MMKSNTFFRLGKLVTCIFFVVLANASWALDPLSYARYDQVSVQHLHLDLQANFKNKSLTGYADLSLKWTDPKAREVILDTRELSIQKVQIIDSSKVWKTIPYQLAKLDPEKGQALHIKLPFQAEKIRIYYHTAPTATALQWLNPAQTMSGKQPFMFSQSQSINARSWVPIQDTPAVRFTYTARIESPKGLRVVMSAENDQQATGIGGWKFSMPQAIPSYLLAIAIGELEVRNLGKRTAVYAEPLRINAAEYELADTEKMIDAAESLYGAYRWGRYDMIVLPPSFPIGGMENPRMTFLTPTMIAGDRSLVDLIAHELAHSWSGNLATNATWKHWWLNEGFTTYVTTRITEALYGKEIATLNLQLEQDEMMASLADIPKEKQALITRDADANPATTYTDEGIAYPKGAWFLHTLEQRAGREAFDPFLRAWFDQHAFQSVTTEQFIAFLHSELLSKNPNIMSNAEMDEWLYGSGVPATAQHAKSQRLSDLDAQRLAWLKGDLASKDLATTTWNASEWMYFLNNIDKQANAKQLEELDQLFGLGKTGNKEVAFRFYLASIHAGYLTIQSPLNDFLMSVGRRKFVLPLYQALLEKQDQRKWTQELYIKAKPRYHPMTQEGVDKLMKNIK